MVSGALKNGGTCLKYLMSKSANVLVLTLFSACLVTLFFSNFVETFNLARKPSDGLTETYCAFSVGDDRSKVIEKSLTFVDLLDCLTAEKKDAVLLKTSYTQVVGVFCVGEGFAPHVIDGRAFVESDFRNNSNTVLVSEELQSEIINMNGQKMFLVENGY